MKLFTCSHCNQLVYFENSQCTRCGSALGLVPSEQRMYAFDATDSGNWRLKSGDRQSDDTRLFTPCHNYREHHVCNWMVAADADDTYCQACQLNRTIPDLSDSGNLALWHSLETEKRRLVYTLNCLELPVESLLHNERGLAFDFLADTPASFSEQGRVITGHAGGLITINLGEADPVQREKMRHQMAEPYRTLLGHFRHESGHYYWERLVQNTGLIEEYRQLFGDEREDYATALDRHYQQGAPEHWQDNHISAYASSHSWEDWAETWAHYLHMTDALETALAFGLRIDPAASDDDEMTMASNLDPYSSDNFDQLTARWLPLTYLVNSLNRSLGHAHAYPFVLTEQVMDKLRFVHKVIRGQDSGG